MEDESQKDWRSLPRKPVEELRICPISLRLTRDEIDALRENAKEDGRSIVGYVAHRCCQRKDSNTGGVQ